MFKPKLIPQPKLIDNGPKKDPDKELKSKIYRVLKFYLSDKSVEELVVITNKIFDIKKEEENE